MAHVISAVMKSAFSGNPLFGLVVSDDEFAVLPIPPQTADDVAWIVNDYTHRFAEQPPKAQDRIDASIYNTVYEVDNYTDNPTGDFQQAVSDLTSQISEGS